MYSIFLIPTVCATVPAKGNVINIPAGVPISPNASCRFVKIQTSLHFWNKSKPNSKNYRLDKKISITCKIKFQKIDLIIWIIL